MTVTDDDRTHPDYLALLRAVRAAGDDDLSRLVLADWLDERAGAVACPYCKDATFGTGDHGGPMMNPKVVAHLRRKCPCGGTGRVGDGLAERGEFIRVQCDIVADSKRLNCPCPNCTDPAGRQTVCAVVRREFELFSHYCPTWHPNPTGGRAEWQWRLPGTPENGNGSWVYSRGFVSTVRGPLAALWRPCGRCNGRGWWQDMGPNTFSQTCLSCSGRGHAGALAALGPEVLACRSVEVTDRTPDESTWTEDRGLCRGSSAYGWFRAVPGADRPPSFIRADVFDHLKDGVPTYPTGRVSMLWYASPDLARAALSAAVLSLACAPYLARSPAGGEG